MKLVESLLLSRLATPRLPGMRCVDNYFLKRR